MNADSIAGTVTAVLCVVVGLLIIGSALVPIVEHASVTETETEVTVTEEVTGSNTKQSDIAYWQPDNAYIYVHNNSSTLEIDGTDYSSVDTLYIKQNPTDADYLVYVSFQRNTVVASDDLGEANLKMARITIADGTISITGVTSGSTADSYSGSYDFSTLFVTFLTSETVDPDDTVYILSSPATIGEGQHLMASSTVLTMESTSLPEGVTMTVNDNRTATFASDGGTFVGPAQWTGYAETTETETTETASEYAPLYAIIPIMLILSMAYVLIRRFRGD